MTILKKAPRPLESKVFCGAFFQKSDLLLNPPGGDSHRQKI
jgi:hypothetical protein